MFELGNVILQGLGTKKKPTQAEEEKQKEPAQTGRQSSFPQIFQSFDFFQD